MSSSAGCSVSMGLALVSRSQSSAHLSLPEESLCCLGTWSSLSLNVLTNVKYLPLNGFVCGSVLSVFCLFVSCFFFFFLHSPFPLFKKKRHRALFHYVTCTPQHCKSSHAENAQLRLVLSTPKVILRAG